METEQEQEPKRCDTWILKHGLYRCGNCETVTTMYVDISERSVCFHCGREMKWYEDKDGKLHPVKYGYIKMDNIPVPMHFTY